MYSHVYKSRLTNPNPYLINFLGVSFNNRILFKKSYYREFRNNYRTVRQIINWSTSQVGSSSSIKCSSLVHLLETALRPSSIN